MICNPYDFRVSFICCGGIVVAFLAINISGRNLDDAEEVVLAAAGSVPWQPERMVVMLLLVVVRRRPNIAASWRRGGNPQ